MSVYAAVDLGASSGRTVAGILDGKTLKLEDVHRFPNGPVNLNGRLHWDVLRLWSEIEASLQAASQQYSGRLSSVGVDTWGVDFALLDAQGHLLGNPFHYRDQHTSDILDRAFAVASREEIFAETGLQFMEFNTLFQLFALREAGSPQLEIAKRFLMMPDLFHYWLTGEIANEYTDASTSQLINPRTRQWSFELLEKFQLSPDMFGQIVPPGTRLGSLRPQLCHSAGIESLEVVLPGTHDTASAVLAVPVSSGSSSWCYISSGTWSLMGVETAEPVVNDTCSRLNFTNEGGVNGTTRLLKNIAGLWLLQECRRIWARQQQDHSWDELVAMAENSPSLVSLVAPDDRRFVAPLEMPAEIQNFCRETGQPVPETPGAVIRCALESLALRYRQVLQWLEQLTGSRIETVHIVGGGSQNKLLNQMAADACNRPVVAGPVEATALGNVLMQAVAMGELGTIADAREVVRTSFAVETFEPRETQPWDEAFERFQQFAT